MNNLFHRDVYYIYRMLQSFGVSLSLRLHVWDAGSEHDVLTRQARKVRNKHLLHLRVVVGGGLALSSSFAQTYFCHS